MKGQRAVAARGRSTRPVGGPRAAGGPRGEACPDPWSSGRQGGLDTSRRSGIDGEERRFLVLLDTRRLARNFELLFSITQLIVSCQSTERSVQRDVLDHPVFILVTFIFVQSVYSEDGSNEPALIPAAGRGSRSGNLAVSVLL